MKRPLARGFTFIELIIAVSIFAVVAVAIYSTFGSGISAWKKAQAAQKLYQEIRLGLGKMTLDLENAAFYSQKDGFANFEGKKDMLSFYSLVENLQAEPAHRALHKITYSLEEPDLKRLEQSFAQSVQEAPEGEPEVLASGIKRLNLLYCYQQEGEPPYKWKDSWNDLQAIPQGIKIELVLSESDDLVFTKFVFIPTGVKGVQQ
jgi:type II secretion system protein J